MKDLLDYGTAIERLRERKGLSREDLAWTSGVSYSYLSEVERGLKRPSTDVLAPAGHRPRHAPQRPAPLRGGGLGEGARAVPQAGPRGADARAPRRCSGDGRPDPPVGHAH